MTCSDEELIARLRVGVPTVWEKQAADRIEALVKDRDQAWEVAHAATDRGMRADAALAAQPSPDVEALVALLAEARTDLAAYVDADWPEHQRSKYPPIQAKWKRDMELCWQIDAALARVKGGEA